MIDRTEILINAGDGGKGAVDFMQKKGKTFGPPIGGDGGKGADVYLVGTDGMSTLTKFRYKKEYKGTDGRHGGANQRSGLSGEDLLIEVPHGTVVFDADTKKQIIDMAQVQGSALLAQGGRGGRGNMHLRKKASHLKHPLDWEQWSVAQPGTPGEARHLILELKLLADIGLVGLPNAGKSTLLASITAARPKIADYPFTTLEPNLGVIDFKDQSFVIADIPGLIAGAHEGKGLGKDFLRHIERTRVLVHLTDSYENYQVIRNELGSHNKLLLEKPEIIVLSKADIYPPKDSKAVVAAFKKHGLTILPISAATHLNLDVLQNQLLSELIKG